MAMYEIFKKDFKCDVYIDTEEAISTIIQGLATLLKSTKVEMNSLSVPVGDILILENKKFNLITRKSPEDGFCFIVM